MNRTASHTPITSNTLWLSVWAATAATLALGACQSSLERIGDWDHEGGVPPTQVADDIRGVRAPEGFDFKTADLSAFAISAVHPQTGEPMASVSVQLMVHEPDGGDQLIARGVTGADGVWRPEVSVPLDRDSVTLRVGSFGYPELHRVALAGATTAYTLGAANANGRVVPDPIDLEGYTTTFEDEDGGAQGGGLASRAGFSYLGTFDADGRPDYLVEDGMVWPDVLDFIRVNLPESPSVPDGNPHYLDAAYQGSARMVADGELWITFAHEGAGYRNSVGYFTYDLDDPPKRSSDIDVRTVIFPNCSRTGSGGTLEVGNRVYLGSFPAGTGVGWFLVPNGWNGAGVTDRSTTRYSVDDCNRFTRKKFRKHAVLLANPVRKFLVLGFEDLNRPAGDEDFNDAVFIVEPKPWDAVDITRTPTVRMPGDDIDGDGVTNDLDLYPDDPERAFELYTPAKGVYGTLAYEDMWPRLGDYDFNDLIVDYNVTEVLNSANEVKDIRLDVRVRAMGASQNHGFAVRLPVDPSAVESVAGSVLTDDYFTLGANGVESGTPNAIVPVFTSGFALFDQIRGIINTDPLLEPLDPGEAKVTVTFATPQYREDLGVAPYDAFMIGSQQRGREIHLAGFHPTANADLSEFNTHADDSDFATGYTYVDANNLPWALCLPDKFAYPQEKIAITDVFPDFADWATYGGESHAGWFRNGGSGSY